MNKKGAYRSEFAYGISSETRRGLMRGMGYTEEELHRPLIGVVNSWNEFNPGHVHLDKLAERVKQGIREAGGLPLEVETTGICDGVCLKDPRYIEVPSRNCIADQVELTVEGNFFDGMVMLSTCDSIVPGHLMGAARCNIPTILVTGGYMPDGQVRGREVIHSEALDKVMAVVDGTISKDEYEDLIGGSFSLCGACSTLGTANSMCVVAETMGLSLPGNSTTSAVSPKLYEIAYRSGKRIVELVHEGKTARDFITVESIKNAIKVDMALAGSANLILHIPAIGTEAGYDEPWWKFFDDASNEIPLLAHIAPSGPYSVKDLDLAGGLPAVLKELMPKLNGDCPTVTGKTLKENVADAKVYRREFIHTLDAPVTSEPGVGVLYGNIAPEGAILKIAGVPKQLMKFRGPANVFDSLDEARDALRAGKIKPGDACVLRFMGLKARFGTTAFPFQDELKGYKALFESCAIITDGRYSGASAGLSVGYCSPEAALGSALAIIENGDTIEIDVAARQMNVLLSDEEIKARLDKFEFVFPAADYPPMLRLFSLNVGSMAKGGAWKFI